jgi:GNAT superfamily N-acetyltransferase
MATTIALDISFRQGVDADCEELVTLTNTAFASDKTTQAWSGTERRPIVECDEMMEKMLKPETCHVLLAVDSKTDRILAMLGLRLLDESRDYPSVASRGPGPTVWLSSLAVLPDLHGTGVGGKLVAYAEDYAVKHFGVKRIMLDMVGTRVELMAWYGRRGYVKTDEIKPFEYKDDDARRTLQPGLFFAVLAKDIKSE